MIGPSYYKFYEFLFSFLVESDFGRQCGHQLLEERWVFFPFFGELKSVEALEGLLLLHFLDV